MSVHWSGDGISSFTFNGKRHMTPGGAFAYSSSYDSIDFEITSRKRIDKSLFDHRGTLGLVLWHNGKKENVTIENAFIREYEREYSDSLKSCVTRITFIAPPTMTCPEIITYDQGWRAWGFASEEVVLQGKEAEEYTEDMEYADYGYAYDYDEW